MQFGSLMKRQLGIRIMVIASFAMAMMTVGTADLQAQEGAGELLEVSTAVICPQITERAPVDPGVQFSAEVGKLYCYSRISNISSATRIFHVWYFNNLERARVELPVKPPAWRTYSSKIIMAHEIGRWRVDILDNDGNVLKTLGFDIAK